MINLAVGHPADSLLPRSVLAAASAAASQSIAAPGSEVSYGRSAGPAAFCDALSSFLSRENRSAFPPLPSELFVTNGASHALDLALGTLVEPGDTVLVERPTYFLAGGVLADHRVRVEELPSAADGLCLDSLEVRRRAPGGPGDGGEGTLGCRALGAAIRSSRLPSHRNVPNRSARRRGASGPRTGPGRARCTSSRPTATPRAPRCRPRRGSGSCASPGSLGSSF